MRKTSTSLGQRIKQAGGLFMLATILKYLEEGDKEVY